MDKAPDQPNQSIPSRRPWPLLAWMIVTQLLMLLSLVGWAVVSGLSFMAFDSGYSTGAAIFVGAIWSYPLLVIFGIILSWIAYRRSKHRVAAIWSIFPFLPIVLYFVFILMNG